MTRLLWLYLIALLIIVMIAVSLGNNKYAFLYGVFVGFVNWVIALLFLYKHQRRVVRRLGETYSAVITSLVVRAFTVGGLLVFGCSHYMIDSGFILLGFVLGQVFYIFYQLVRMVENGE